MELPIKNRKTAGQELAKKLSRYKDRDDVIVLGLPRGGVPVALEISSALNATLDLMLVRKLGTPWHKELAMGAIASGGIQVINEEVVEGLSIAQSSIEKVAAEERQELVRRERAYRGDRPWPNLTKQIVILVDDGIATGSTMRAAIDAVYQQKPQRVIVAVPVSPPDTIDMLKEKVDEVVCLATPVPFSAISQWYWEFNQVSDDEVREMLDEAWAVA